MNQVERTENETSLAMRAGFTLMEILVAVAIIGILGTVAVQGITGHIEKTKVTAAKESCVNIANAVTSYYLENKKYPTDLKELTVAKGDEEPLITGGEGALEDPWGTEYKYEKKGKRIAVISAGPDGEFGNSDDLRSDETKSSKKD